MAEIVAAKVERCAECGRGDLWHPNCPSHVRTHEAVWGHPFVLPAPDPHPEDTCERCGRPNVENWHAPSPLWNAVMREPETGVDRFNVVCPGCFALLVQEKGIGKAEWKKTPTCHASKDGECIWAGCPLVIDPDEFAERALPTFVRNNDAHGLSMEPIALCAIIESAARPKLDLTHPQRLELRTQIAEVNRRLTQAAREAMGDTAAPKGGAR